MPEGPVPDDTPVETVAASGTDHPSDAAAGDDTASGLLDEVARLRREARAARHAYWFPLLLFGGLTLASVPLYVEPEGAVYTSPATFPALSGFLANNADLVGWYWLVALIGGF